MNTVYVYTNLMYLWCSMRTTFGENTRMIYIASGLILISAIYLIYRAMTSGPRSAVSALASAVNVQPSYVDQMLQAMGPVHGTQFVKILNGRKDTFLEEAVITFFVFQSLKNPDAKNVAWWREKLESHGFRATLDIDDISGALDSFPQELTGRIDRQQVLELVQLGTPPQNSD